MTSTFREIQIVGSLMPEWLPAGSTIGNGDAVVRRVVVASDVLAQIAAAERDGIRSILLVSESPGGDSASAHAVYRALRRFSDRGGRVVAFVQGFNASSAPLIVSAADFVMMRADGRLAIHRGHGDPEAVAYWTGETTRALAERTGMAIETLRAYCGEVEVVCQMHDLGAVRLGWADCAPATIDEARALADELGRGGKLPTTPRTRRLAALAAAGLALGACGPVADPPAGACAMAHQTQSSDGGHTPRNPIGTQVLRATASINSSGSVTLTGADGIASVARSSSTPDFLTITFSQEMPDADYHVELDQSWETDPPPLGAIYDRSDLFRVLDATTSYVAVYVWPMGSPAAMDPIAPELGSHRIHFRFRVVREA